MIKHELKDKLILYRSKDGSIQLDITLEKESIWLTLDQISQLFERDKSVISRHLRKIFDTNELERNSVVAKYATTAADGKTYQVDWYNLDAIISVGYRVNSKRGTEFRIWATNVLKQHIVNGYTANEQRLKELKQALKLMADVSGRKALSGNEATSLLQTISQYAYALDLLDDYDHQRVAIQNITAAQATAISYEEALSTISEMHKMFSASDIFGKEKDESLKSSLNAIMQSFDGKDVYPSLEEKAANLLYFLVKNHSFLDGNKRIAAVLFLRFLEKNSIIYHDNGEKRVADNALVAITLMIAESKTAEKSIITTMVTNLINRKN